MTAEMSVFRMEADRFPFAPRTGGHFSEAYCFQPEETEDSGREVTQRVVSNLHRQAVEHG
jgi:hypothetical protein